MKRVSKAERGLFDALRKYPILVRKTDMKGAKVDEKVEVDLDGHMACIISIWNRLALPPWQPNDEILVSLEFDKRVGNTLGFAVQLPVRNYSKDYFLFCVREEGKKRVKEILASYEANSIQTALEKVRQADLDRKVEEIKSMVGLK